jgi:PEP-CTERM putative exosortase interaction domain
MKLGRRWLIAVVTLSLLSFVSIKPTHAAPFQPGQIFVAYGGNQIAQISPPYELDSVGYLGPLTYSFATSATNLQGGGVALDENGYLYVTFGTGSGNRGIVKIAPDGSVVKTITVGTSPDFRGIAARGGKVAVATNTGVRIYDSDLNNLLQTLSGNYRDVVFDDAGNLYALHQTRVDRYKLVSGVYQLDRTVVSGLGDAVAITFDGAGNLYVVDRSGQQVKKFVRAGDGFSGPTNISRPSSITGGNLFGIGYEPGINTFFVVNTSSSQTELLRFRPNDTTMAIVFSSTDIRNARWLAVYRTSEPAAAVLLLAGLGWLVRRVRRRS